MDSYSKIRKLRKKLRQIEHLEGVERDLTEEEIDKCIKKEAIRDELLQLLHDYNANSSNPRKASDFDDTGSSIPDTSASTSSSVSDFANVSTTFTESGSETQSDMGNASYISAESDIQFEMIEHEDVAEDASLNRSKNNQIDGLTSKTVTSKITMKNTDVPAQPKKTKSSKGKQKQTLADNWRTSSFDVTCLESHNDLVTAVDVSSKLFISASRDTTVKVWDMDTLSEVRSLGGHTGSVTDVLLLPCASIPNLACDLGLEENDHVILSASTDCSLNVWSANTGEMIQSIYTYNPIMKIGFHAETSLVVIASGGGKLELWDIIKKENINSEHAHSDSITGLQVCERNVFTSCAVDGEIKVFEVRDKVLHCVFASENIRDIAGHTIHMRHVRSLAAKGDKLYYGDDGVNVKILTWKKALIQKLANHKEEFGMTDAICCHGDIMLTSAYDLDNGQGYMNVFDMTGEASYIATIDNKDTGRIFDIACCHGDAGVIVVTAGVDLQVWKQVKATGNNKDTVSAKFIQALSQFATDSDLESDVEFSETESEAESGGSRSRRGSVQAGSWMSWCNIL